MTRPALTEKLEKFNLFFGEPAPKTEVGVDMNQENEYTRRRSSGDHFHTWKCTFKYLGRTFPRQRCRKVYSYIFWPVFLVCWLVIPLTRLICGTFVKTEVLWWGNWRVQSFPNIWGGWNGLVALKGLLLVWNMRWGGRHKLKAGI